MRKSSNEYHSMRALGLAILLGLGFLVFWVIPERQGTPGLRVPTEQLQPQPAVTLSEFQKEALADLGVTVGQGVVVVLSFWAHWCEPCKLEIPEQAEFVKGLQGKPLRLLAINSDGPQSLAIARQFWKQYGWNQQFLYDQDGLLQQAFQLPALPGHLIFDSEGRMAHQLLGAIAWTDPKVTQFLESFSQ